MKKVINALWDWRRPYIQLIAIIVAFCFVLCIHGATFLADLLAKGETKESIETVKYFILVRMGDIAVAGVVAFLCWQCIRKTNKDEILNSGNFYHDHIYGVYWICSKVLGYKSCRLILVPVPMQFKLVIRDTFPLYLYEDGVHEFDEESNDTVRVSKSNDRICTDTINLVIADTYEIVDAQIPEPVRELTTIKIDRAIDNDMTRYKSEHLINKTITEIRSLPDSVDTVNLFGTLNPYHCFHIAKEVFAMGGRSTIKHLVVYPQSNYSWEFKKKGMRVY